MIHEQPRHDEKEEDGQDENNHRKNVGLQDPRAVLGSEVGDLLLQSRVFSLNIGQLFEMSGGLKCFFCCNKEMSLL